MPNIPSGVIFGACASCWPALLRRSGYLPLTPPAVGVKKTAGDWPPPRYRFAQTRLASEAGCRKLGEMLPVEEGVQLRKGGDAGQVNHVRRVDLVPGRDCLRKKGEVVKVNVSDVNGG
jgi:hypothetical protein